MKSKRIYVAFFVALLLAMASGTAWAKDAVQASIPPGGAPGSIQIDENGNPYSPGTYAVGTLKIHYTVVGTSWTPGEFTNFTLNVKVKAGKPKPPTNYPATVRFRQAGSGLELAVTNCVDVLDTAFAASSLTLYSADAEANCNVRVSIPTVDASLDFDGALLVGNLQMETPAGTHLDTVTTVQVRVMLVFPTTCLRLFNMITDIGIDNEQSNLTINVIKTGTNAGRIQNTSPNNLADVVYVVNTCTQDIYFDLRIDLENHFVPNLGNSVQFHSSTSFDPDTEAVTDVFDTEFFNLGGEEPGAPTKCIANRRVGAQSTLLVRAGMNLPSGPGTNVSQLPGSPTLADLPFDGVFQSFESRLSEPNSTCGALHPDADPNQITLDLPFTAQ